MALSFDMFDYPRTITYYSVTAGYTNQATGAWVPEVVSAGSSIAAHIQDLSIKEKESLDPGLVALGTRKLLCETSIGVKPGDRIQVVEESGSTTNWTVKETIRESNLLKKHFNYSRSSFLLVKK